MRRWIRSAGALVVGLAAALLMIVGIEVVSEIFHPFPPGVDPSDFAACKAHVARYPQWLLAVAAVGWGATALVSTWLATLLGTGRHAIHGLMIGALLLLAAGFNVSMLPYPQWFKIGSLLLIATGVYLGTRLGRDRPTRSEDTDVT